MGVYSGNTFLFYEPDTLLKRIIYGAGADLVANGSIFYHVPVTVESGVHYGTKKRFGGGYLFYFAVTLGIDRATLRASNAAHLLQ